MCVRVIPVGILRGYLAAPCSVRLAHAGQTLGELLVELAIPSGLVAIALVNGFQRPKTHRLAAGDVVKLVPLMGGG
jgi:sulfur carrier protein ThiS